MGEYVDLVAAVKDLQQTAEIRSGRGEDPVPARLKIIRIYSESIGRPDSIREAKRVARELVVQRPEARTHLALARVLLIAEEQEEARAARRTGIEAFPRDGELRATLVMHLIASGDLEAAREAATLGAAETSGNPDICVAQARVFEAMAEKAPDDETRRALTISAADAYVQALTHVPQNIGLRRRVVDMLLPGILSRVVLQAVQASPDRLQVDGQP